MHLPLLMQARTALSLLVVQAVSRTFEARRVEPAFVESPGRHAAVTRVFVVGCERSGTTLLQSLLAAHSAIHSVPETHFVKRLFRTENRPSRRVARRAWTRRALRNVHAARRTLLARFGWIGWRNAREAWRGVDEGNGEAPLFWQVHSGPAHMRRFVGVMDRACVGAGKRVWLEKTPEHLFYVAPIRRHVQAAKFVHIVRDGEEVVASLNRLAKVYPQWQPFEDACFAVERWNHAWRETKRWIGHPDHLVVRYETLMRAPRRTLARILEFLDCQPEPELWKRYPDVARRLIRADEPWKAGNLHGMRDCRKFAKAFDAAEQARIRAGLDKPDWNVLAYSPRVVADFGFVYD